MKKFNLTVTFILSVVLTPGTGVAALLLTVGNGGATIFQRKRVATVKEKKL